MTDFLENVKKPEGKLLPKVLYNFLLVTESIVQFLLYLLFIDTRRLLFRGSNVYDLIVHNRLPTLRNHTMLIMLPTNGLKLQHFFKYLNFSNAIFYVSVCMSHHSELNHYHCSPSPNCSQSYWTALSLNAKYNELQSTWLGRITHVLR